MGRRVIIAGFGDAGKLVLNEIKKDAGRHYEVLGFLDDDLKKIGKGHSGAKVIGRISDAGKTCEKLGIEEIIIAIPSAKGEDIRRIIGQCTVKGVRLKILPSLFEIIRGDVQMTKIRPIRAEDLIGRKIAYFSPSEVGHVFRGKKVMVTGGAGSIGTELAKRIIEAEPSELVLLDIDENGLYFNLVELGQGKSKCGVKAVVANIRERGKVFSVFSRFRPDIVFHAAASKQVPIVEENVAEGVKNNIIGTKNVLDAAIESGVERFVFISTDKAVSPSSAMGSTKRVAEWLCKSAMDSRPKTKVFIARFGNVFGSKGSVIPLFMKQIEETREITITDRKMTRYFMAIEEAVALLLKMCSMEKSGTYFFDMGEQIKIYDLAMDLVKLHGLEPGIDVKIRETGLRPGEKISEALLTENERKEATEFENITRIIGSPGSDKEAEGECEKIFARLKDEGEAETLGALREIVAGLEKYSKREK